MKSKTLFLDITSNCNLRCKMCYNSRYFNCTKETFDFNVFLKKVDFDSLRRIHILGGEPLLSKHLFDVLDIANKKNIKVSINTNAVLLNIELFKTLLEYKCLDQITVSLEGSSSKENDYFRGKGVFEVVLNNLEKIRSLKTRVKINIACVITNHNIKTLKDICLFSHLYDSLLLSKLFVEGEAKENNFFVKPKIFFSTIIELLSVLNSKQIDYQIDLLPIELNWIHVNLNLPLVESVEDANCYKTKLYYSANNELFPCNPSSFFDDLYKLPNPKEIISKRLCQRDCYFNNKCKICDLKYNSIDFAYCDYVLKKANQNYNRVIKSKWNSGISKFMFSVDNSIYFIDFKNRIRYKIVDNCSDTFTDLDDLYKKVSISEKNRIKLIVGGLVESNIIRI